MRLMSYDTLLVQSSDALWCYTGEELIISWGYMGSSATFGGLWVIISNFGWFFVVISHILMGMCSSVTFWELCGDKQYFESYVAIRHFWRFSYGDQPFVRELHVVVIQFWEFYTRTIHIWMIICGDLPCFVKAIFLQHQYWFIIKVNVFHSSHRNFISTFSWVDRNWLTF